MDLYKQFYRKYNQQANKTIPEARFNSLMSIIENLYLEGDVAELGVGYGGTTKLLSYIFEDKTIYAFDTFEGFSGLPEHYTAFESDRWKDWGTDTIQWDNVIQDLEKLNNVVIRKGIFPNTAKDLSEKKFCFVHIDTDIFLSTYLGLEYFYDKMHEKGIIVVDDLFPENSGGSSFPQVRGAVKGFFDKRNLNFLDFVDFKEGIGHGIIKISR